MKIAVLGGTSHIAKNLVASWKDRMEMVLFCRNRDRMSDFLREIAFSPRVEQNFALLGEEKFDIIINCIGAGTPRELASDYNRWFTVLEKFDNLCLDSLRTLNRNALYVTFSSGAVYGRHSNKPVSESSCWDLAPNRIAPPDFYGIAKIYSEAKHRSLPELRIADLRIFSFFSRYASLDSGYFMTDAVRALLGKSPLRTSPDDMVRDYPSPGELAELILHCASIPRINSSLDVSSSSPVSKKEILSFLQNDFGLKIERVLQTSSGPNGRADVYVPTPELTASSIGWHAEKSSLDTLREEITAILKPSERSS